MLSRGTCFLMSAVERSFVSDASADDPAEKALLEVDQKLAFIARLEDAGAKRIEAVSFVNPRRVPQMAGAEEIMGALPHKAGRSRIGLVLNMKG